MPNFSIPLSGLAAEGTALSTVANNLANQNTTGYKDKVALFSDLFYQNIGTTDALFVSMPTRAYQHDDPDVYRLPIDTDQIPYRFDNRLGW